MHVLHHVTRAAGVAAASLVLLGAQSPPSPQTPANQPPPSQTGAPTPVPPLPDQQLLLPTVRSALPMDPDDYWFAPRRADRVNAQDRLLASSSGAYAAGNFTSAASYARQAAAAGGPLDGYAQLYVGLSNLRMSRVDEAEKAFDAVLDGKPEGQLAVSASLGKAECKELRGDHAGAADIYDTLSSGKTAAPDEMLQRLGRAALDAGDRPRAAAAFLRVYYEFPLSDAAATAATALASLQDVVTKTGYKPDLGRGTVLFGAKRYPEARSAYEDIRGQTSGDDRELVDLRIAECDDFLKRYAAARD
ncbi:MAG: tetratricopeptide repeat protein [Vicinamibacterales bacterium]